MRSCHTGPGPCHTRVGRLGASAGKGLRLSQSPSHAKAGRSLQLVLNWWTEWGGPFSSGSLWDQLGSSQLSSRKALAVFSVWGRERPLGGVLRKSLERELQSSTSSKSVVVELTHSGLWQGGRGSQEKGIHLQSPAQGRSTLRHRHALEKACLGCTALPGGLY